MLKLLKTIMLAVVLICGATAAQAACTMNNDGKTICSGSQQMTVSVRHTQAPRGKGCPTYLGCGCNLANYFNITGKRWRDLWVARNWAHEGRPAAKGCINCVAVLRRGRGGHVGVVRSYDANDNPVIYSYANRRLGWTVTAYPSSRVISYRQI